VSHAMTWASLKVIMDPPSLQVCQPTTVGMAIKVWRM
jgi:hypothetical protein